MTGNIRRFGVLVPPANIAVEDEFRRHVPAGVQYHVARLYRSSFDTNYDTMTEMVTSTEQAAKQVAQTRPEVIAWACTSGSFIEGKDHDEGIARRIQDVSGIPAITTSTAMVSALRAVNARRVYLVTPYVQDLNEREERFLRDSGFTVTHTASFLHPHTLLIGATKSADVVSLVMKHRKDAGEFDTVFMSCTQLHSMDQIEHLEQELGVPVISSNQATLWASLRHMGIDTPVAGLGRLFHTRTTLAA